MTLEQQLKLLDYRSSSTPTQKDPSTIWIDGNKITGYFEYFYVNAKSYAVGDNNITRSLDGTEVRKTEDNSKQIIYKE